MCVSTLERPTRHDILMFSFVFYSHLMRIVLRYVEKYNKMRVFVGALKDQVNNTHI